MNRINDEEVKNQLAILCDRFTEMYKDCKDLANDKEVDEITQ
jgi:hypothetical protein